jgi:hypothetical protein
MSIIVFFNNKNHQKEEYSLYLKSRENYFNLNNVILTTFLHMTIND